MKNDTTIIAPASPNGTGALAIIRISGIQAHSIVLKNIREKDKFFNQKKNVIARYTFVDSEDTFIDEITAIKYVSPHSYTGENMVEIICHGSRLIVFNIIEELKKSGATLSKRGEFTQRAFLNGKIDLIKAENIKMHIECNSVIQKKINQNIYNKRYEKILKEWIITFQEIITVIETEIEFSENIIINKKEDDKNKNSINFIKNKIEKEIKKWNTVQQYNSGIKIVIAGPTNAGKSSLFNKILGYDRAIVSNIPGTTRDTISEKIIIEKNELLLIDTAGIRETKEDIEKQGVDRSLNEIEDAHIVLWVTATDLPYKEPEFITGKKIIKILNKIDLLNNEKTSNNSDLIKVSIEKNLNIEEIVKEIILTIKEISEIEVPEIITSQRQMQIAQKVHLLIDETIKYWDEKEKAAYFLYKILEEFEEYFGKRDKETIYNNIFDRFCIGK